MFLDWKQAFCSLLDEEGPLAMYGGDGADKLTREEARAVEPVAPELKPPNLGSSLRPSGAQPRPRCTEFSIDSFRALSLALTVTISLPILNFISPVRN